MPEAKVKEYHITDDDQNVWGELKLVEVLVWFKGSLYYLQGLDKLCLRPK
jgi:hypothetical protein